MREVVGPIIAIVLVLSAVFIPVMFIGGIAGQMYRQFAVTISISVIFSGIVALTLTPALCALILKPHDPYHKPARFFVWYNWWFARVTRRYISLVRTVKKCGVRSMLLFACMLLAMGWLFKAVPISLVPKEDQGRILGVAILADGAIIPRTEAAMNKVRDQILANPIVQDVTTLSGFDMTSPGIKSNYATFFVMLKNWSQRTEKHESGAALAKQVRAMGAKIPEANIVAFEPAAIRGMLMATFVATIFVPFFFTKIMYWTLRLRGKNDD